MGVESSFVPGHLGILAKPFVIAIYHLVTFADKP